ncbi:hypothetical protein MVEN_01829800 [Mycena venus]|uniref:Uncharacterized protein n=1 Tax=Mycena venus TaxID=2733690 RepID=A0A8H6XIZ8_9AGAR|nr:hypothetical protein MVEN_01829800 [Mycena venus]
MDSLWHPLHLAGRLLDIPPQRLRTLELRERLRHGTENVVSGSVSLQELTRLIIVPAKAHIRMHTVKYRGTPQFGADGEEYVDYLPGEVRYVGPPSDEIDEAWNQLTTRRFFLLSDDEAREQWGPGYRRYWNENWGGYAASLDLFHTLHCLDHIRKSLYPDHYHQGKLHGDIHNGHCIDHIRQQIMCQADLTPLPSQRFENVNKNYLDSDRTHTCRDFSQIRQFVHMRYNQSLTGHEVPTGHYAPGHEGTSSFGPV